jgi:hypothetical protein
VKPGLTKIQAKTWPPLEGPQMIMICTRRNNERRKSTQ